jgi:heptosyltransferase-2
MLSIGELCEFFRRCDLLISNDSGPVHLAAALGLRTVALFGPETPSFYGPLSTAAVTVAKPIPCSPCMNVYAAKTFKCPYDAACMKAITVEDVKLVVEEMLQKV